MADEREQQFERALARLLRDASPASQCPDAEILSAYHDGTLPPEQVATLKEHITGCVPCQEVLTLVAQSENVPFEEWQNDHVPVLASAAHSAPAEEAAFLAAAPARASSDIPTQIAAARSRANWRWLVPIGALAAGLIAWVGVREAKLQHRSELRNLQTAANVRTEPALTPPTAAPSAALNDQGQRAPASDFQQQIAPEKDLSALPAAQEAKQSPVSPRVDHAPELRKVLPSQRVPAPAASNALVSPQPTPPSQYNSKEISRDRNAPANAQNNADALMQGRSVQQLMVTPAPAPPPPAPAVSAGAAAKSAPAPSPPSPSGARAAMGVAGGLSAAATPEAKKKLAKPTDEKARLSGRVTDPSGAVVPGTNVQLFDQNGALVAATSTDSSGSYSLSLPTGQYRLELQQAGFKTNVIDRLNVSPGENRLNGELEVGSTAETVEVSSQAALVQTESSPASQYSANKLVDFEKIVALDQRYILAPGGKYVWHVGQAGKIDRSSDGGKTWQPQPGGVSADLTAGSAASEKICWVVGKNGTILLTTDAGKHWKQLRSPIDADLGGIHATDATHAVIRDAANQNAYETSDGGVTWTRSGNQ